MRTFNFPTPQFFSNPGVPKPGFLSQSLRRGLRSLGVLTVIVFAAALAASASATDIYLAQNLAGGGTGADCADARAASFFNTSGNWGSGASQIGAGTTVHLCGTISNSLTAMGNGATNSPVTILFESGAKISAPFCAGDSCINLSGKSWITINGGSACGWVNQASVACNGIIESTANGTNLANQVGHNLALDLDNTSHVEVENVLIQNIYVHVAGSDSTPSGPDGCAVYYNATNLHIHNITGHDMRWCFTGNDLTNIEIDHTEAYNIEHAVSGGADTPGTVTSNLSFHDNYFHDWANWDITSGGFHHDGFQIWALSNGGTSGNNGVVNGLYIYNNLFTGNMGVNHTGYIYMMDSITNAYIYNNVIIGSSATPQPVYADIRFDSLPGDNSVGPSFFVNNTIVGNNPSGYCAWVTVNFNVTFKNNVVLGCQRLIEIDNSTLASGGLDDNIYQQGGGFAWNTAGTTSLATWQSQSGGDANSKVVASAGVNANGVPQAGAAVIGVAANLTSIGVPTLDEDHSGDPRPASGSWDAGAYEFGVSAATQPAPPTDLTATVQ